MIKSIKVAMYEDLPEDVREYQPNNGCGREWASYLIIEWSDGSIQIESDAMEPEDVKFYRDLSWIKSTIERLQKEASEAIAKKDKEIEKLTTDYCVWDVFKHGVVVMSCCGEKAKFGGPYPDICPKCGRPVDVRS